MPAKPYAASHIGAVATNHTDLRISADVKSRLVELSLERLDHLVPSIEQETLGQDPERKTLDDPSRTRLNYNRTRELMIDRISTLDSVGSAAVQRGIEEIEGFLSNIIRHAERHASNERVGTIKPRHLSKALETMAPTSPQEGNEEPSQASDDDPLDSVLDGATGAGVLTSATLRRLAKSFARLPVDSDAIEEVLLMHYDQAERIEHLVTEGLLRSSGEMILNSLRTTGPLLTLGFAKRALEAAGERARSEGASRVELHHVVQIDLDRL